MISNKYFGVVFLFVIACTTNAMSLEQCVKLSPTSGTCTSVSSEYRDVDAIVNCSGTQVTIVSTCAMTTGTADVTALDDIVISSAAPANNKYCWCKIVSPVTSKWVYRYMYSTNINCAYSCVRGCANAFLYAESQDVTFRTTAYSNLVY
ncbi:MAG: hypothetical protein IJY99_02460 [Alphaproteobacteria bacterium]|nr:hypothetical protein [Alphaproteobacteria bacterium]